MNAPSLLILPGKGRRLNPLVLSDAQLAFDEFLGANFFGQPDARRLLRLAYSNYLNPLRDPNKPIAFLVFAGESRTGKTHGARMIPQFVHGNQFALLKINCSEYMDKHSLWNLKGSPRGHISNQVATDDKYKDVPKTEKHGYAEFMNHNLVWSKQGSEAPLTVVLLDEWDKACYEFNLLLLQAMDDGQIVLGSGEIVDFRNTIFIAACNSGMEQVEKEESGGIGFTARKRKLGHDEVSGIVEKVIKEKTPPEFRNRLKELGGTAVFDPLTRDQMRQVVDRDCRGLQDMITTSKYFFTITVTEEAKDEVLRQALANDGNLSNVKALISREIQIPLGVETTKKTIKMGDTVTVDVELPESSPTATEGKPVDKRFFLSVSDPAGLVGGVAPSEPAAETADATGKGNSGGGEKVPEGPLASATAVPLQTLLNGEVKASAGTVVTVQDFMVNMTAEAGKFAALKEKVMKLIADGAPYIKVTDEHTKFDHVVNVGGLEVHLNILTIKVEAPIGEMMTVKRAMPELDIEVVACKLEV